MKRFFRCFSISFVIILNITVFIFGICKSYENIRRISFGEYVSAIEIRREKIRILDFEFEI